MAKVDSFVGVQHIREAYTEGTDYGANPVIGLNDRFKDIDSPAALHAPHA